MNNATKFGRFVNTFTAVQPNRKGECTPNTCSTLDGKTGAACCHLNYTCPALTGTRQCGIYPLRPRNCRTFPANENDLKLVRNCGYHW